LNLAAIVAAAIAAAGAVLAAVRLRHVPPTGSAKAGQESDTKSDEAETV
jgi:DHA2 family multidrug resistance protein-like MFS transporter